MTLNLLSRINGGFIELSRKIFAILFPNSVIEKWSIDLSIFNICIRFGINDRNDGELDARNAEIHG